MKIKLIVPAILVALVVAVSVGVNPAKACDINATLPTIQPLIPAVPVGTSAVVEGTGWNPGEAVQISIENGSTRTYTADSKGNVKGRVVIPFDGEQEREYRIIATNQKFGFENKTAFSSVFTTRTLVKILDEDFNLLTDNTRYNEVAYTAGEVIYLQGSGFYPLENVTVHLESIWDSEKVVKTDQAGDFLIRYTIPADVNFDHLKSAGQGVFRLVFKGDVSGAFRRIFGLKITNN